MSIPIQAWESELHRTRLTRVVQAAIGAHADELAVPRNVVEHISSDHPKDAHFLTSLGSLVSEATFFDVSDDNHDKFVIYSNYELVWLRVILIRSTDIEKPSILLSL